MDNFEKNAINFMEKLHYKEAPYSGRNWGNSLHSLCSYHGKLKPSIAHFLINNFTKRGDIVLDPLCGVGTIPLEACLQGRVGIGNDMSEMAYIVTKAKLELAELADVEKVVYKLADFINHNINKYVNYNKYNDFGFNGRIQDYFHPDTFVEILCARDFFTQRLPNITSSEAMVYSAFLHILHGNRPYALSRTSHPLTPYAPKGDFVYKNVVEYISKKINLVYNKKDFTKPLLGKAILGNYSAISDLDGKVDSIISSPPFANSIRFYMNNWMRLWLCGWELEDFQNADSRFLDVKQNNNFDVYIPFFDMCYRLLKDNGIVILHLGKTETVDMAYELANRAKKRFEIIYKGYEDVSALEKHGIKDKGGTITHEFLFLKKK